MFSHNKKRQEERVDFNGLCMVLDNYLEKSNQTRDSLVKLIRKNILR